MTTLDSQRGDVAVVVAAGGAGQRLGGGVPKALQQLAGEPLLRHAVRRVTAAGLVGCVVVAAPPGYEPAIRELFDDQPSAGWLQVVTGGTHRRASVAAALAAVPDEFGVVLVHDAARALAPGSLAEAVAAAVRAGHDAVIPVLPVTDTISEVDPAGRVVGTPDRSTLRAVQTPQGFRRPVLAAAHAAAAHAAAAHAAAAHAAAAHSAARADPPPSEPTDDAGLVAARLGVPVHTVPGSTYAMKITTRQDLVVAEALLAAGPPDAP